MMLLRWNLVSYDDRPGREPYVFDRCLTRRGAAFAARQLNGNRPSGHCWMVAERRRA